MSSSLKICDLSSTYLRFIAGEISRDEYHNSNNVLFQHYLKYWGDSSWELVRLSDQELEHNRALVLSVLELSKKMFAKVGLYISELEIILFIGQGTNNGHAYLRKGKAVVWFPLETYTTKPRTETFVIHELSHGLHYKNIPELYFDSKEEKDDTLRMLITEGIATYLSYLLEGYDEKKALWADYLTSDKLNRWYSQCQQRTGEIATAILASIESQQPRPELFQANEPDDLLKYRAGYYIGLQIIKSIVSKYQLTPIALLQLSKKEIYTLTLAELRLLAKSGRAGSQ